MVVDVDAMVVHLAKLCEARKSMTEAPMGCNFLAWEMSWKINMNEQYTVY